MSCGRSERSGGGAGKKATGQERGEAEPRLKPRGHRATHVAGPPLSLHALQAFSLTLLDGFLFFFL